MEESDIPNNKMEEPIVIHDKREESNSVNPKLKKLDDFNDTVEAFNNVNGETSEVEDLDISESEEIFSPVSIPLNIDCNARIVTKEVMCDNEGDDCDMQFVEKSNVYLLSHRGSEAGLHTSTEDLNVSDDEHSCASALQSINLDGLASTSKKGTNSLSTSNFSHTVFKDEFSFEAEYLSDEEIRCALRKKSDGEDKYCQLNPELKLEGMLLTFRQTPFFSPSVSPDASTTYIANNVSPSSITGQNEKQDFNDGQNSPSKTCIDFNKSEYYDDHNTDAEDISFGSLDDIIESSKSRNPFGKGYNAFSLPETLSKFSTESSNDERQVYSGDSRRSSAVEFLTDDETLTLENFCDHEKKRIKKFDFSVTDKNEKYEDSYTDEEDIEDQ